MITRTALALACAVLIAACGAASGVTPPPLGNSIPGHRLSVYVAVPLDGRSDVNGEAVVQGANMALQAIDGRIGRYRIELQTVDDASAATGGWNAPAATQAAQLAARDRTTIGYIGDLDSGASAISIPILNRLGIAQVSPGSTAVGLTSSGLGSSPGEPLAYYPSPRRTFARVVPSDLVQAEAQVTLQRQLGCTATYVLDDGEYDGEETAAAFDEVAQARGLQVVSTQTYVPRAASYVPVGQTVAQSHANCVLIAAITTGSAVKLTSQVAASAPHTQLFATMGLADSAFASARDGGIPASVDSRIMITAAAGDPTAGYPGAATFDRAYRRAYGPPEPVALDGYEAMNLMLSAIRRATDDGRRQAERLAVVQALFATRARRSPLGTYSIEPDGDTTLESFGVYRIVGGRLRFWRALTG